MSLLNIRGLTKTYPGPKTGYPALRELDLDIDSGEFVGIMGPSGSGKTSLLNIVATLDTATSGSVEIEGRNLATMKESEKAAFRRTRLGFIFQDHQLLDSLSARENILLPLGLSKISAQEQGSRVNAVAEKLGLLDILDKKPYELSGGQKQRVAAARALAVKPALILADEPTGNLDSRAAAELLGFFKSLHETDKVTILMVTHDPLAASYCSSLVFIKDGRFFAKLQRPASRDRFYEDILNVLRSLESGASS